MPKSKAVLDYITMSGDTITAEYDGSREVPIEVDWPQSTRVHVGELRGIVADLNRLIQFAEGDVT